MRLLTPYCPLCSQAPVLVLGAGTQAFCGNDDCDVVCWDMTASLHTNLTDVRHVQITENRIDVVDHADELQRPPAE